MISEANVRKKNLVSMGVLPCQFKGETTWQGLNIDGSETFDLLGISDHVKPQQVVTLVMNRRDGSTQRVPLLPRVDTPIEADYLRHGGILPYVLRKIMAVLERTESLTNVLSPRYTGSGGRR